MGTNYYFRIKCSIKLDGLEEKSSPLMASVFNEVKKYLNEVTFIHIGKKVSNWKPLFQKSEHFSSITEMRDFYHKNKSDLYIEDESGRKITFEELETELINWNKSDDEVNKHSDCFFDPEGYAFVAYDFN